MISVFFTRPSARRAPVATSSYRQLVNAANDGIWGFFHRQFNWGPSIKMKDPLELAKEQRRQRLLIVYLALASVVVVCVLLFVATRLLQRPQALIYAKIPDDDVRTSFTQKPREDLIDRIDRVLADTDCQDQHACQLWADVTHQISELDGNFAQTHHSKCMCVDQMRETLGVFHVLYYADETVVEDILGKLMRLSGILSCHEILDEQGAKPRVGSSTRPRQTSAGGPPWRPNWKQLDRLQGVLARVRSVQQWQVHRKELLKLTRKFNKTVTSMQLQLFSPVGSPDFETLRRDIPIMREVLSRLKQFEASCEQLSPHAFRLGRSEGSHIFRCGQFDVSEYYQAALYEGASKTPMSDAALARIEAEDLNRVLLQAAHVRTLFTVNEPESSDAIEEIIEQTHEAKIYAKQARHNLEKLNTRGFFRMLSKTRLADTIKAVVASALVVKSLVLVIFVIQVAGFTRFRSLDL